MSSVMMSLALFWSVFAVAMLTGILIGRTYLNKYL
jgi:hypothetical protein